MTDAAFVVAWKRSGRTDRRAGFRLVLIIALWAVPNSEAAEWHDRIYDLCMVTLDDDRDWECETRLVALGE